jgi:hypothetical protein
MKRLAHPDKAFAGDPGRRERVTGVDALHDGIENAV